METVDKNAIIAGLMTIEDVKRMSEVDLKRVANVTNEEIDECAKHVASRLRWFRDEAKARLDK